mgnify:CR=1 FL=1
MFLVNQAMEHISIGTAGIIVVLGMIVVFIGLILLMWVTQIAGKIMVASEKRKAAKAPAVEAPAAAAVLSPSQPAPGTAGEMKLYDVPDKTAALLMAIVADKRNKPLNELRFRSIREVK